MLFFNQSWQTPGRVLIIINFLCLCLERKAVSQTDSLRPMKEVIITGRKMDSARQGSAVFQTMNHSRLEQLNALQASDAVKYFAGVMVKDYGGIGGLKTISVRSLGANYTGIAYDGVLLGDQQSGQIDLGKIPLEGIESISLFSGDMNPGLRTARAMASGSLLSIETQKPLFTDKQRFYGKAGFSAGSFGFINPFGRINAKITPKINTSLDAGWQQANGQYPFTLDYGGTSSKERRTNSDIISSRLEWNTYYTIKSHQQLRLKLNGYLSERGLPGATVFYNPYASQRLRDKNFFVHTSYTSTINSRYSLLVNLKYTDNHLRYIDPGYLNILGRLENNFSQHEYYSSAALQAKVSKSLDLSLATDLFAGSMRADLYQFAYPSRYSWLTASSARYAHSFFSIQANVLTTVVEEKVKTGPAPHNHKRISPSFAATVYPFGVSNFQLRLFYKDIFRMPTFNELYYTAVGNTALQPEKAKQFNAGFTYHILWNKGHYLSATADGYVNRVLHKIIAIPTKNLFIWSMMNVGKVNIKGMDITLRGGYSFNKITDMHFFGAYSVQRSLDVTDAGTKTYRHQVPYTPVHSGSLSAGISIKGLSLDYNALFSGSRYSLSQNTPANYLSGYAEHGFSISKKMAVKRRVIKLAVEALNITDSRYEVIRNFPMPGRSFRLTTIVQ